MADLQGRALDAAVAERVMGWADMGASYYTLSGGFAVYKASWSPSENYAQTALIRAEIERRGLQHAFVLALIKGLGDDRGMTWVPIEMWLTGDVFGILNASPEQQCRAALKAVEGANA